ncbi:MAG: delta-60 repeat domain-containing protein, partial [Candidatus Babeliales bacterium]
LSCNAEKNGGNGFVLDNVDTSCLKWCKANVNCFHGICDSACNGDNLYVGCIAKQNGIDGFNVAGGGKVMQKCIASQNTGDGFNLSTPLFNDANLDITFGVGGIVTTSFGSTPFAQRIAQQKDGKLVVVGTDGDDFAIGRYNTDGSLDASFGTSGIVITAFSGGLDAATGVAIQDNGKIVVGGVANFGSSDFAVARYNVDGSLDLSFGVSGKVTTAISGVNIASSIALQKDGKIVVVGLANAAIDAEFATVRYNTDGSLDTTFGIGGIVTTSFAAGKGSSRNDVAIQKDGKIVVVGGINDQDVDFVVVRYNTNGSLDESFGLGGIVTTTFEPNNNGNANAVVIQKDGKIVVAGQVEIIDEDIALARYNIDGTLDTSFNPTGSLPGTVVTDLASEEAGNAIALQKDGKIIVAGNSNSNFVVLRYRTDGLLDTTFNPTGSTPGTVITNIEGSDIGTTVVIQQNGKIVVAGTANIGEGNEWAIARYIVLKQGVAIQNCVAEENGQNGFDITGSAYLVRSSSAIHNALNGFSLESLTDGCQLLDNQALQNANDGFLLASLTDSCQLISNSALQNTNVGIENLGSLNQIFNSRAYGNTSADYIGISLDANPPLVTTGFWTNVRGV